MTQPLPTSTLDHILTAQLAVAWAGETADPEEVPRLGWWNCDLTSEFGGAAFFAEVAPATAAWACLQAVREAARRTDAGMRARVHDPDQIYSLYRLGAEVDQQVEDRLQDLKQQGRPPADALPGLQELIDETGWTSGGFDEWVAAHGDPRHQSSPAGRRIRGDMPQDHTRACEALVAALRPLSEAYPLPHYRRSRQP